MSFSCHRCNKKTHIQRKSMFNNDMICQECQRLEKDHFQFEKARDAVIDSISRGDYEFEGIGLPNDLKQKVDKTLGAENEQS